jgi:hypothetical protein
VKQILLPFLGFVLLLSGCKYDVEEEEIPEFNLTFPIAGNQEANRLTAVSDGVIMVGTSTVGADKRLLLLKTDFNGNDVWQKTLDIGTEGFGIKPTSDGGLLLSGSITLPAGDKDLLLIKTDLNGNVIWHKHFGGVQNDIGRDGIELQNGDLMMIGTTQSSGPGVGSMFVVKTDGSGNQLWSRTFGGDGLDGGTELIQMNSVEVMLLGFTNSFGAGDRDLYLQGVSIDGDSLGSFLVGGAGYEEAQSFQLTSDGGFVMCNHSASNEPNHSLLATRLTPNLQTVWETEYGTPTAHEGGEGVLADSEGNYVFLGRTNSFGNDEQVYFIKTDATGNTLEELNFGADGDQRGYDIIEHNSSYYICGTSVINGDADILFIKRPM